MPAMCEGCKASTSLTDRFCSSCQASYYLKEREEQAKQRLAGDESETNPLEEAEGFPNRFTTLSYFFNEGDGIEIVQDLDWEKEEPKVYYFHEAGKEELSSGALYEWAINQLEND